MARERAFIWALAGASAVVLLLHLAFAFRGGGWGWGVHHLAFFPVWLRIGLPVLGLVLVLPPVAGAMGRLASRFPLPEGGPIRRYGMYGLGAAVALAAFVRFRVQHHLLGDGALWIREMTGPLGRMAGEPLTVALVRFLYGWTGGGGAEDAERVYRMLSWGCGAAFVFGALLAAEGVGRNRRERVVAALFLLSLGTLQLFFGYVEHYAPVAVGLLFYLFLGLRCLEGRAPLAAPAAALGLACAFHFVGLALLPSFCVLILKAPGRRTGLQAAVFPLVLTGSLLAVGFGFGDLGIQPRLVPLWGGEPFHRPHALLSAVHIADVINVHLLVAPLGLLLCLCLLVAGRQRIPRADPSLLFLGAAAAAYLIFTLLLNPAIGAFRDWDLFGISGLPVALLGAYLLTRTVGEAAQREAAWMVGVVSLFHLVPWVGVNADGDRALARFEAILSDGSRLSVHALGSSSDELRGEYERRGEGLRALRAAERALEAHPRHPRYLFNVVHLLRKTGQDGQIERVLLNAVISG